jgi:dihydroxyacetone kinase-like protein
MKKLINAPDDFVTELMEGMAAAHPELLRAAYAPNFLVRADAPVAGKVAVVSGGGSGHEPLHGGFVGRGMLAGACPGAVFTSPTPDQIIACAQAVDGGAGVLLVVKNYTGDVLSFETAAEFLALEGIPVATVLVDDDVAVKDSLYTAGRRGTGATLVVEKIAGAAAADGCTLAEVEALARRVNCNSRSMGMALTPCVTPAAGRPSFELGEHEVEIGIGIHGEPGQYRTRLMGAAEIAALLVGDRVVAVVNGMGGTPLSELYIVARTVAALCKDQGLHTERTLVGSFVTSLDMQGVSVTLARVDDELLKWWDAPVVTPALRWGA